MMNGFRASINEELFAFVPFRSCSLASFWNIPIGNWWDNVLCIKMFIVEINQPWRFHVVANPTKCYSCCDHTYTILYITWKKKVTSNILNILLIFVSNVWNVSVSCSKPFESSRLRLNFQQTTFLIFFFRKQKATVIQSVPSPYWTVVAWKPRASFLLFIFKNWNEHTKTLLIKQVAKWRKNSSYYQICVYVWNREVEFIFSVLRS